MRKYFLFATLLAVFAFISCEKLSVASEDSDGFADITFSLQPMVSDSMTRATLAEAKVTKFDFAIFYYKDSKYTLYKKIEQESTDDSFGVISLEKVPYGSYKVVAIGHLCSIHATINSDTDVDFGGKVPMAYSVAQEISVNDTNDSYSLVLKRVSSQLTLKATDTQLDNVTKLDIVITGSSTSFDPSTGISSTTAERTSSLDVTKLANYKEPSYYTYMFLPSAETKVTVVLNFKDKEGNIVCSKSLNDVPMKPNCVTTCTGALFSWTNTDGFSFSVDDSWVTPISYEF